MWGMVRPTWWCSSAQRRGKKPYCAMRLRRIAANIVKLPELVKRSLTPICAALRREPNAVIHTDTGRGCE